MGLESLSAGTVRPLNDIVPIPLVAKDVPFEQSPPSIKLILARNSFLQMPSAICDLENLTLLSLRGCGLKELPPAIGRLTKLQTLNLAQNQLTSLPGELLNLLSLPSNLQALFLQGNNFRKAAPLPEQNDPSNPLFAFLSNGKVGPTRPGGHIMPQEQLVDAPPDGLYKGIGARFLGRSPIEYSDSTGRRTSKFSLEGPFDGNKVPVAVPSVVGVSRYTHPAVKHTAPPKASAVPSLLELAARSCYRSSDLEQLVDYLPESLPGPRGAVERAVAQRARGGQECTGCGKTMVTPSAQWLEWWQVASVSVSEGEATVGISPWTEDRDEQAIPFLRQGCTWNCIPESKAIGGWMGGVTPMS